MTEKEQIDESFVRTHFWAVCDAIGVRSERTIQTEWDKIHKAYTQPHRHHHTLALVADKLRLLDELPVPDREMTRLQAFLIYADYKFVTADIQLYRYNEAHSANHAREFLGFMGASEKLTGSVFKLIYNSRTHMADPIADPYSALGQDIDQSHLGGMPEKYDAYTQNYRHEFAHIDDDTFDRARLNGIVKPLLESPRIFLTDALHLRFNAQARANLAREATQIKTRIATRAAVPRQACK